MLLFLLQRWKEGTSNSKLRGIVYGACFAYDQVGPYLDLLDKRHIKRPIPPRRELHCRRVSLLVLNEADPDDILLFVFQEETNALKTTRVSGPAAGAGNAPREAFCLIPVRHASCELQLRMKGPIPIGSCRRSLIARTRGTCNNLSLDTITIRSYQAPTTCCPVIAQYWAPIRA